MSNEPAAERDAAGAALVVGAGIAGMQSALDLADAGFRVYLLEKESAVGGHMARLDKTFPTNDCAMCTISPRLVEIGRHPDVELITQAELVALDGVPGDFTATVRTRPRFVDPDRCTACGACAEVCPESVPSEFEAGLAPRRAAYKRFPQAVPNAFAIDKPGTAPCRAACPAGQRAQGYVALVREGRFAEAYEAIRLENPFPGVCGRICDRRCESACSRGKLDEPVAIRALKRFVADTAYAAPRVAPEPVPRRFAERVAIVGAGPCGLTAAHDLCRLGYACTVFDALPVAGGMLRVGVPAFRLPAGIVDREVADIVDLGVELRLSTPVSDLDALFAEGYAAVLVAVGAHEGARLPVEGADLDGVLVGIRLLRDARLAAEGLAAPGVDPAAEVRGRRVAVLGGGDVAMDVARTALRLGAAEAHVVCVEARDAMRATPAEVAAALAEGVVLHTGRAPARILDAGDGRVGGLEHSAVTALETAPGGGLRIRTDDADRATLECDVIAFAVGQRVGLGLVPDDAGVRTGPGGIVEADPVTCATGRPGVFAAGDSTRGTAFAIEAVAAGHRAAESIHRYLRGEAPLAEAPAPPAVEVSAEALAARAERGEVRVAPRVLRDGHGPGAAAEAEPAPITEAEARAEAARCLSCGVCGECLRCVEVCGPGAIDHAMRGEERRLRVGAVVLAPGFRPYAAEGAEEYGLGRFPNVVTSLAFERLLSASGPTGGHVRRPSDGRRPRRIAFLQCVGSRDRAHDYCSSVCCMAATKQAIMAIEHEPDTEARVFMMDVRAFGKGYEAYYRRAREHYRVGYTRCRISEVDEDPESGDLVLRYVEGWSAADGGPARALLREETFDLVVLMVGMEIGEDARALAARLGVALDAHGFCRPVAADPLATTRPGVFAAGPFREPKDIPDSLVDASAAAASVGALLHGARHTRTAVVEHPRERDVGGEEPRLAVFACHCGTNIGGVVDVPGVAAYARGLPGVVHAEDTLYACAQDSIAHIARKVRECGANRVVVAACTPLTHEPLFQASLRAAGLSPYLFDMANVRNQCSWVHGADREAATVKAKDLVRMAAARAARLAPLPTEELPVTRAALVIGGGAAGMSAALALADQGFPVHLVEREAELGGQLRHLRFGIGEVLGESAAGPGPRELLARLVSQVRAHPAITVHLRAELAGTRGFVGRFASTLRPLDGGEDLEVAHGVTLLATGGREYRGPEHGYGKSRRVVTQQQLEALLARHADRDPDPPPLPRSVVMIQCVGPAERYCARICCTYALKNALALRRLAPESEITVAYRDIRTYGFKERLYTRAREEGVLFVRYDEEAPPAVETPGNDGGAVTVRLRDAALARDLVLEPDLVVLSTPVVPDPAAERMRERLKVPLDGDGFYLEAHAKLRPVDFLADGVFMAGTAHFPKLAEETIVHARAAAARAARILARDAVTAGGRVAAVAAERCVACLTCVRSCPFGAVRIDPALRGVGGIEGAAVVEPALCRGCGLCAAACPASAIDLGHYTGAQVLAKIDALFERGEQAAEARS